MYIPKHFLVEDRSMIYDFIDNNSFGILFSMQDNCPQASHLPFLLDRDEGYLHGHFAKPNDQWQYIQQQEVLIVFQGPHTYISSSWYETNQSVPTWNYVAVHAYGRIEIIEDLNDVVRSLEKLVAKYEDPSSTYKLDQTNKSFIEGLSRGIVAFKMKVDRLEGKWVNG
ncbi:FMN-binding negative transcriptional regulator [Cohnella yongneupensis]|uniref:FMN-binding negative transcriptional regulator n=1 Tax=Cohnella yongneupensis TaxID=425006 RepID=A0ABW0QW06_9BACL